MLPEYTRRSIVSEAAKMLLDYVEREQGVKDVSGLFDSVNEASKGVFRKLGFEDRGLRILEVFGGVSRPVFAKSGMDQDMETSWIVI